MVTTLYSRYIKKKKETLPDPMEFKSEPWRNRDHVGMQELAHNDLGLKIYL